MRSATLSVFLIASLIAARTELSGQTRFDTFIPLSTGDSLDATYFVPTQTAPSNGYPGIVFVHGFGEDKFATIASCSLYASDGYVTLCFSVRGHGLSSGGSTIMADRERADFAEVIEWFRSELNVDTSAIGIVGGSQGGLHGLWAAADRLPVAAVSSDVIVPYWASDMLMNGTVRRTAILLLQTNTVHYDASRDTLWNLVRTDAYESFRTRFIAGRDVDTARLNSASVPTLRLFKWQDHYFGAEDGIQAFQRYAGPKKMYAGTRGHFSDLAESEREYQYDQVTRWTDRFLKNANNGIDTDPMYAYAYSSLPMDTLGFYQWTRVESNFWPPAGIQNTRFYLDRDSSLGLSPSTSGMDSVLLSNDYLNPAYTFDTAYIEGFHGSRFDAALPKRTLGFTSEKLQNEVTWIGAPKMKLLARSDYSQFPLHAQIYEVDSSGNRYFVNRINFTARSWPSGATGTIDVEGIAHAHRFSAGNRIRVELTNIDVTNRKLLGIYPFVVPMMAQAGVTILADAAHQSYIELPLIGSPTSVEASSGTLPVSATLLQNYPNPFNPTTTLSFVTRRWSPVQLAVYDVVGREVMKLVDEVKEPGAYRVIIDGSNLASGTYLAVLRSEGSIVTKKMLLMK